MKDMLDIMYSTILLKNRLSETTVRILKRYGTFFFRTHKIFFSLFYRQIDASFPPKKAMSQNTASTQMAQDDYFWTPRWNICFLYAAVRRKYKLCLNKDKTILISYGLHSVSLSSMHIRQNLLSF